MSHSNYDFHFELAGRSGAQGAIAPAEQFFEGSIAETSLAREIGQNSLDARAGDLAVRIKFELADVQTDSLPGIETLRSHFALVAEETKGSQGNERMVAALEHSQRQTIPVLRISDYGTTGLGGSESKDDNKSALSALTRGAGISANDGRGGSFGIGSAVGPMSSSLCTVLYTSLPIGEQEIVFAGYSRLASHRDTSGEWRNAEGFFTDTAFTSDFRYLRNPSPLIPFESRSEPGTDIFVLGYRKAEDDPGLGHLRRAFLSHFLVAIHRGRLVVEGEGGGSSWRIDSENLGEHVKQDAELQAFYLAIQDANPIIKHSARLGQISLHVHVDDSLERSLHTIALRTPLMKIHTFRNPSVSAKYAAILECSDDSGNQILRALEPPQHDRWDPGRAYGGSSVLAELRDFVRAGLRSRVKEQVGESVEIKGLARYLPSEDLTISSEGSGQVPAGGAGTDAEAATVHGKPLEPQSAKPIPRKTVSVRVRSAADADGDEGTEKGKDRGGSARRKAPGATGLPASGGAGKGNARISRGDVRFRSWSEPESGYLNLALTSSADVQGDVELVAIGAGGTVEDDYQLPIRGVELLGNISNSPVVWNGNVLVAISLAANETTRLRLKLDHGHRYRLDVK